jgi:recombination protein RecT
MTNTTPMREKLAERSQEVTTTNGDKPTIADLINRQRSEIARALPRHMDADRLARIATTTIKTTPQLMQCSAQSLLGALMLSAQTGMEPGPLGHAYLVPRKSKDRGWEATWILGYKGIIELARRSGQLESIEAREVCERDEFEFEYGLNEKLRHVPAMEGERGPIVAFYGVAKFKDGGHYFLVMSKADVDQAKERSDAGKRGFGPWISDYAAMGRKTVIRRMAPYLPLSPEQAQVIAHDETVNTRVAAGLTEEPPEAGWVMDVPSWEDGGDPEPDDGPEPGDGEVDDRAPTQTQMRKLFACLSDINVGEDDRHGWAAEQLQRDVSSFSDLNRGEIARLIDIAEGTAALDAQAGES